MTSPDVVVVGAGVAGLRAAVHLAARGARVAVFEAKAVLGGRATAFTDPQTGERVDNGQHVMLGCYHETFAFLRQIGTEDRVRVQPALEVDFVDRAGERSRLSLPGLPAPMNFAAGLLEWKALAWRDRLAAMRLAGPIRIAQAAQRAESRGQTPTRIAASPERDGRRVAHRQRTDGAHQGNVMGAARARSAQSIGARGSRAAVRRRPRADARRWIERRVAGAAGVAARPVVSQSPRGDSSRSAAEKCGIGCPARVHLENGRLLHIEARGDRVEAGSVVAAVPWYALVDLFAGDMAPVEAIRRAAASTAPSPIASVNLWLSRRILRTPFLGLPGRSMQWVFDKEQMFETETSHLTLVSSGADDVLALQNDELISLALRELREAVPEARAARVVRASVVKERRATFSLAPGQPKRPPTATEVKGLVLAGDWIETGLPATIEGAAISGRRASEAIS